MAATAGFAGVVGVGAGIAVLVTGLPGVGIAVLITGLFGIVTLAPVDGLISSGTTAGRVSAVLGRASVPPMAGTYKVIQDDWADWGAGDLVTA